MLTFREFLLYSDKLYEAAKESQYETDRNAFVISSIFNSWAAIESFINNMMEDFASLPEDILSVHEKGFLEEKQVRLANRGELAGTFQIEKRDEFWRLEDKIMFLIAKFGYNRKVDKGAILWQRFEKIKRKRNALTHPRRNKEVITRLTDANEALSVSKEVIALVHKEVWGRAVKW